MKRAIVALKVINVLTWVLLLIGGAGLTYFIFT